MDKLALSSEDKAFVGRAARAKLDIDAVAGAASTPEEAAEIYTASLLAIDVDNAAERGYLGMLAARLQARRCAGGTTCSGTSPRLPSNGRQRHSSSSGDRTHVARCVSQVTREIASIFDFPVDICHRRLIAPSIVPAK